MASWKRTTDGNELSFLEHLEELRWHLLRGLLYIVLIALVAFMFRNIIFDWIILAPKASDFFTNRMLCQWSQVLDVPRLCINQHKLQIINIKMAGQFQVHIKTSLLAGVILGFPLLMHEFWRFVKPALYDKEKKQVRGVVFYTSALFFMGAFFGYFIISPLSIHFLGGYNVSQEVTNQINLSSYIGTLTSVVLASAFIFELPIIIFFLSRGGLVTAKSLKHYRRHSIVAVLALAAVITPPDVFSQLLVCVPLIVLYEFSILMAKRMERKQAQ